MTTPVSVSVQWLYSPRVWATKKLSDVVWRPRREWRCRGDVGRQFVPSVGVGLRECPFQLPTAVRTTVTYPRMVEGSLRWLSASRGVPGVYPPQPWRYSPVLTSSPPPPFSAPPRNIFWHWIRNFVLFMRVFSQFCNMSVGDNDPPQKKTTTKYKYSW